MSLMGKFPVRFQKKQGNLKCNPSGASREQSSGGSDGPGLWYLRSGEAFPALHPFGAELRRCTRHFPACTAA